MIEDAWIGDFDLGGEWTFVEVHFAGTEQSVEATIDMPFNGEMGLPLKGATFEAPEVHFDLSLGNSTLTFDGQLEGDTISGEVRQDSWRSPLHLTRVMGIDPAAYPEYLGTYELAPGRIISIGRSPAYLYYLDSHSGKTGPLFPLSETTFFAGTAMFVPYPRALTVTFRRDELAYVTHLLWAEEGSPDITAKKVSLYIEEEVLFQNGDVTLAGTLFSPATSGPHPAAVIVHGSGPQARDSFRSYLRFHADVFARNGVAALFYDKRGVGASTGNWAEAGFDDLAGDALAGLKMLQGRADIDAHRVGLMGTSQAGWVIAKATSLSRDVAFVIIVSAGGAGISPAEQNLYNTRAELTAAGFSEEKIDLALTAWKLLYSFVHTGKGSERLDEAVREAQGNGLPGDQTPPLSQRIDLRRRDWWFLALDIDLDPIPYWEKYEGPLLALFGELDRSTPVQQVVPRLENALKKRTSREYTIKVFPKAEHTIMEANTGSDKEVPRLRRYIPEYFNTLADWLLKRVVSDGRDQI